jgi:hypothetical protein
MVGGSIMIRFKVTIKETYIGKRYFYYIGDDICGIILITSQIDKELEYTVCRFRAKGHEIDTGRIRIDFLNELLSDRKWAEDK